MKPLPQEGGYYVETYRCGEKITLLARYSSDRNLQSAILYLLTPDTFSSLHRLKSDEIYHFYLGGPVKMLLLYPDGSSELITLGHNITNGQQVQVTVPQGSWQGCFLSKAGEFALMGTTMSPAFEFADFEAGQQEELIKQYPDRRELILKLTEQQ